MAINKKKYTSVLINFPNKTLKDIEDYQFNNKIKSRTKAVVELIEKGLAKDQLSK